MPLYQYRCMSCGNEFDEFSHVITDGDAREQCPKCNGASRRILSTGMKFSFGAGDFFEPYTDTDIHPDGKPINISSKSQFMAECEKHGRGFKKIRDKMR